MPYPRWLAKVNRRLFNPREVRRGRRPVVIHTGRSSGTVYHTPIDAHPTVDGFVLVVRYGPASDWVRNALAAGGATLRLDGVDHRLTAPRLIDQADAVGCLPPGYEPGGDFFKAEHYLVLDRAV